MSAPKSSLQPTEVAFVVDCAFKCANLPGRKISDCKQLSKKLSDRVGVTISATTLYRMVNAVKYQIIPYDFTMQALYAFCGENDFQGLLWRFHVIDEGRATVEYSFGTALAALLSQQLEKERFSEVRSFLAQLPGDQEALLLSERHEIGRTLGFYFRGMDDPVRRRNLLNYFLEEDHFFVYFFETFPDLDYAQHYFFTALEDAIIRKGFLKLLDVSMHEGSKNISFLQLEKAVYAVSLYMHLAFQLGKRKELKRMGDLMFPNIKHFIRLEKLMSANHIILARFYNAYNYYLSTQQVALKFAFEKQMELLHELRRQTYHPWQKMFTQTILFDSWQIMDTPWKKARLDFQDESFLKQATLQFQLEPFMHRYLAYFGEEPLLLKNKPKLFKMGNYEIETSRNLIAHILSH